MGIKRLCWCAMLVTDMVAWGQGVPHGAAAIAKVSSADEIAAAVLAGAKHIVVTRHLNLTTLPSRKSGEGEASLIVTTSTLSITVWVLLEHVHILAIVIASCFMRNSHWD
jgi:hypothetical protein